MIESYYGTGPAYSYWNGCSQGGRQGLALAERYPTAFDGIVAGAPAIFFEDVIANIFWAQEWMNLIQSYPHGCELDAITAAAVTACDDLDGVVDGIVSEPEECLARFDPFQVVGTSISNCSQTGTTMKVSEAAASVANASWQGIVSSQGKSLWYGFFPGSDLTGDIPGLTPPGVSGVAGTNCTSGVCVGAPNALAPGWFTSFIGKDPNFNYNNLTHDDFDRIIHSSKQQYHSFLAIDDPDLSEFHSAGGKIISFHGLVRSRLCCLATWLRVDD